MGLKLFTREDAEIVRIRNTRREQEAQLESWKEENVDLLGRETEAIAQLGEFAGKLLQRHGGVFMREVRDGETTSVLYNQRWAGLDGLQLRRQGVTYPLTAAVYEMHDHPQSVNPHYPLDEFRTALGYHATMRYDPGVSAVHSKTDVLPSKMLEVVQTSFESVLAQAE